MNPVTNYKPRSAETKVTLEVDAQALSTGAQFQFDRMPLFIQNTTLTIGKRKPLFGLPHLNWILRQAALARNQAMLEENIRAADGRKRKKTAQASSYESFPTTVEEFIEQFKYIGMAMSKIGGNPKRGSVAVPDVKYGVQASGEMSHVAAYWGDHVRTGDRVGFCVKKVPWGPEPVTDWEGNVLKGSPPPVDVVQVLPVHSASLGGAFLGSEGEMINVHDFFEHTTVRTTPRTFNIDPETGKMTVDEVDDEVRTVKWDRYHEAHYIQVGIMLRRWGPAVSEADIRAAITTQNGHHDILRDKKMIDIQLGVGTGIANT